jgi:hypothetical protein
MNNTIKYTNDVGIEMTFAEAMQLDRYHKVIVDNNNNKYIEIYIGEKLSGTTYYVKSSDEITECLKTDPNASFYLTYKVRNYKVSEQLSYQNAELSLKRLFICDISNNLICLQNYDVKTGLPKYLATDKSYYDEFGTEIYAFVYNEDGQCFSIDRVQIIDTDAEFLAREIGVNPEIDFTWAGFEYYQNAEPLIPISSK